MGSDTKNSPIQTWIGREKSLASPTSPNTSRAQSSDICSWVLPRLRLKCPGHSSSAFVISGYSLSGVRKEWNGTPDPVSGIRYLLAPTLVSASLRRLKHRKLDAPFSPLTRLLRMGDAAKHRNTKASERARASVRPPCGLSY